MHLDERLGNGARWLAGRLMNAPAVLLGLAAAGCGDSPETVRLDVYSWWDESEEKVGFDTVARMHMDRHENVEVRNLDSEGADGAREEMSMRMLAEAPPATFQANIGADVLRWAVVDTERDPNGSVEDEPDSSSNFISPLDDLFSETGFTVPEELAAHLRVGEGTDPFAVPLNIHRVNVLYYNKARRKEFEDRTGKNLSLFDTLCPLDADDPNAPELGTSIALAYADPWPLILLVFENILPALVAADPGEDPYFYTRLFEGQRPGSEKVERAFECAQYLARSAHMSSSDWLWADTVRAVANPRSTATFTVMGNWANPLLKDALANDEVGAEPFPGTNDIYVYTSDTFPLPVGVEHSAETVELLKTFASEEGQIRFSREKGSIPARLNVNFESPWPASEGFPTMQKLLATSGYFPPYYPAATLARDLRTMMQSDVDPRNRADALRSFTDLEPLLFRWQERLRKGLMTRPPQ